MSKPFVPPVQPDGDPDGYMSRNGKWLNAADEAISAQFRALPSAVRQPLWVSLRRAERHVTVHLLKQCKRSAGADDLSSWAFAISEAESEDTSEGRPWNACETEYGV